MRSLGTVGHATRVVLAIAGVTALAELAAQTGATGELAIAAASDLQTVMSDLARAFEKDSGASIKTSFGSSGNFFAQIQNGAPFDVFLSADVDYPRQLTASGHADPATLYEYANGRIVLWTRKESGIDVQRGLAVLQDPRVKRIAIANPAHAPYGRAAVAALRAAKLYETLQSKLVLGENIAQAAQFAESGNAEIGIIGLAAAMSPAMSSGTYFRIPPELYPPIQQAAVVVSSSKSRELARQFIDYLKRPETAALFTRFGFEAPRGLPSRP